MVRRYEEYQELLGIARRYEEFRGKTKMLGDERTTLERLGSNARLNKALKTGNTRGNHGIRGDTNRYVGYKKFPMAFLNRYRYKAIGNTGACEEIRTTSGNVRSCKKIGGDPKRNAEMPGD